MKERERPKRTEVVFRDLAPGTFSALHLMNYADLQAEGKEDRDMRFLSHVKADAGGCWMWTGEISGGGGLKRVPLFRPNRATSGSARQYSYEMFVGPDPGPLKTTCKKQLCVHPEHLKASTLREKR